MVSPNFIEVIVKVFKVKVFDHLSVPGSQQRAYHGAKTQYMFEERTKFISAKV